MKLYRIRINSPFELRVVENNGKVVLFVYHRIFNTTPKLRAILLSKEEARELHRVLGKIVNEGNNPIQPLKETVQ
ncbi:MAG: hypothetical protein QW303_06855 [Nitrososphaerota archaeon]